jgi:hypothetical protein
MEERERCHSFILSRTPHETFILKMNIKNIMIVLIEKVIQPVTLYRRRGSRDTF